jgi:hypothetical protein
MHEAGYLHPASRILHQQRKGFVCVFLFKVNAAHTPKLPP